MSSRIEAERQRLLHAQRQRDLLIREVHHRIKNNLQGVTGLLRQHVGEHPELRDVIERAKKGTPVLGICNGFQVLTEAGLLPGALETNDGLRFWISAEDSESYRFCDYYDGYQIPDWEFGVSPVITKTLDELGLFAEWQNPAQLNVWEG